jgi:hypothetical protein
MGAASGGVTKSITLKTRVEAEEVAGGLGLREVRLRFGLLVRGSIVQSEK